MQRLILLALGAAALSGCTGTHLAKLPVCDGKHRRSANPYGSILPALPVPQPPSISGAPEPDTGPPAPGVLAPFPGPAGPPMTPEGGTGSQAGIGARAPAKTSAADAAASYRNC